MRISTLEEGHAGDASLLGGVHVAACNVRGELVSERYRPWSPVGDIVGQLVVAALHDDVEGFRVLLQDAEGKMLRVAFDPALAYRNINESYRLALWQRIGGAGQLLNVENSRWCAWLLEEAGGLLDDVRLSHYAVFTAEDCIEVITTREPSVSWLPPNDYPNR